MKLFYFLLMATMFINCGKVEDEPGDGDSSNPSGNNDSGEETGGGETDGGAEGGNDDSGGGDDSGVQQEYMTYGSTLTAGGAVLDDVSSMVSDNAGNLYLGGKFAGSTTFFGMATPIESVTGNFDGYLSKFDSAGTHLWTHQLGADGDDQVRDLAADSAGNVYVLGNFTGPVDFDFSEEVDEIDTDAGSSFVTKINADGSYAWTLTLGYSPRKIAVATDGAMYLVGQLTGTRDFDFTDGVDELTVEGFTPDLFVTKLTSNTSYGWTRLITGSNREEINGLAVDSAGDLYLAGTFYESIDLALGGDADEHTSAGASDAFFAKVSATGDKSWGYVLATATYDTAGPIAITQSGDIVFAGTAGDQADMDPTAGSDVREVTGRSAAFLMTLTPAGAYTKSILIGSGSDSELEPYALTIDNGHYYLAGRFYTGFSDVDFDFGETVDEHKTGSAVKRNAFVTKVNMDDTYGWTRSWPSPDSSRINGVVVSAAEELFAAGRFSGTVDFDFTESGTDEVSAVDSSDVFFTKIVK